MSDLRDKAKELYKPPFRHDRGYIFDADSNMVADDAEANIMRVRGWGRIGYMEDPELLQDEVGVMIAEALTAYWTEEVPSWMLRDIRFALGTPDQHNIVDQARSAGTALRTLGKVEKLLSNLVFECRQDMKEIAAYRQATDYLDRRNTVEVTLVPEPIKMILHCPKCHVQHIDEATTKWSNPPHRSHQCQHCGTIWRPADVCTEGVATIATKGKHDN